MEELKLPEPVKLNGEHIFCLQGCRSYKQYYEMRKRFEAGICAFCTLPEENKIIWQDEHAHCWQVPEKYFRKEELQYHFLIAPKRHVRREEGLTDQEILSMHYAQTYIAGHYHLPGGAYVTRFGSMIFNAGTVDHLHKNIYVPSGEKEFRVPLFKDPADREKNVARAAEFAKRYEAGEVPSDE